MHEHRKEEKLLSNEKYATTLGCIPLGIATLTKDPSSLDFFEELRRLNISRILLTWTFLFSKL